MQENKEMDALFQLIDDPDEEVFGVVSTKIIDYGKEIIPNLEHLWENTINTAALARIEHLIHRLHFYDLKDELIRWMEEEDPDLLTGALLVSKFQEPDLSTGSVFQEIERLRRNIWLELNSYLTPLEQVNVVTSILYNYYSLKGEVLDHRAPEKFLLHQVLETKVGNGLTNGILYIILSSLLDVPVQAVQIPRHFLLAYYSPDYSNFVQEGTPQLKPLFFIEPMTGQLYSQQEIEEYLLRQKIEMKPEYYQPMSHFEIIEHLFHEFSLCFKEEKEKIKREELTELSNLLLKKQL